ncbi:hypothetical protein [Brucella anthropi]|uniref:hypothetical protein n=1 Tax=Brucella anthropi TaxID=529 RepID=UPI00384F5B19
MIYPTGYQLGFNFDFRQSGNELAMRLNEDALRQRESQLIAHIQSMRHNKRLLNQAHLESIEYNVDRSISNAAIQRQLDGVGGKLSLISKILQSLG